MAPWALAIPNCLNSPLGYQVRSYKAALRLLQIMLRTWPRTAHSPRLQAAPSDYWMQLRIKATEIKLYFPRHYLQISSDTFTELHLLINNFTLSEIFMCQMMKINLHLTIPNELLLQKIHKFLQLHGSCKGSSTGYTLGTLFSVPLCNVQDM